MPLFTVPDALQDLRFASNPLVLGPPYIRFYAGAIVRAPNGAPVGTVCIIDTSPRDQLTEVEAQNLSDLAALASDELALREARLALEDKVGKLDILNNDLQFRITSHESELKLAALSQRQMLPASPLKVPGATCAAVLIPSNGVAGDTFGYGAIDHDTAFFWIADVSGHGVKSALLASSIAAITNYKLSQNLDSGRLESPAALLRELHEKISLTNDEELYFTMCLVMKSKLSKKLIYASAGQPGPFLIRPGYPPLELASTGAPVGLFKELEVENAEVQIEAADRLILYSDGILDCQDLLGMEFGVTSFYSWIKESSELNSQFAAVALGRSLVNWSGGLLKDDCSAVVIDFD